jgi:N-methylhydantoinase A
MLVPRYLRRGVRERVLSNGEIRTPMNEEDVRDACTLFNDEGVETVAISFVWSVLVPRHELRAAEIVREMMPDAIVTVGQRTVPAGARIHPHLDSRDQCLPRPDHAPLRA